jgi:Fe-S cluster assembly iron-binding protein IscA
VIEPTEIAPSKVEEVIARESSVSGSIRVDVPGGCFGFSHRMDVAIK